MLFRGKGLVIISKLVIIHMAIGGMELGRFTLFDNQVYTRMPTKLLAR